MDSIRLADKLMADKNYLEAARALEQIRNDYDHFEPAYKQGLTAFRLSAQFEKFDRLLHDSLNRFPCHGWPLVEQAEALMAREMYPEASSVWGKIVSNFPSWEIGYQRGLVALRSAGLLCEVQALLERTLELMPETYWVHEQQAEVALAGKDFVKAGEAWARVRDILPHRDLGYRRGLSALRAAGQLDEAQVLLQRSLVLFPNGPWVYKHQAQMSMFQKNYETALEAWSKVRSLSPKQDEGYRQGLEVLCAAGRLSEARDLLDQSAKLFPQADWLRDYQARLVPVQSIKAADDVPRQARADMQNQQNTLKDVFDGLRDSDPRIKSQTLLKRALTVAPEASKLIRQLAGWSLSKEDFSGAAEVLSTVKELLVKRGGGYQHSLSALQAAGLVDSVQDLLEKSKAVLPKETWPYEYRAEIFMGQKYFFMAAREWAKLIELAPDQETAYRRRIISLRADMRFEDAQDAVRLAWDLFPDASWPLEEQAELFMACMRYGQTLDAWQEVLKKYPHSESACRRYVATRRLALQLDETGMTPQSAGLFFFKSAWPYEEAAEFSMARKNYPQAALEWERVRELFPALASGYRRGIFAYKLMYDFQKAENLILAAERRFPEADWLLVERAELAMSRNQLPDALKLWRELRDRFPKKVEGYIRGANTLRRLFQCRAADELLATAKELFPWFPGVHSEWAEVAMAISDYSEAGRRWAEFRSRFPSHSVGYRRAAAALCHARRFDEAEELLDDFNRLHPGRLDYYLGMVECSLTRGDAEKTVDIARMLREHYPRCPVGYIKGAQALSLLGEDDESDSLLDQCQELFPYHNDTYRSRYFIFCRKKQWAPALDCARAMIAKFPFDPSGYCLADQALLALGRREEAGQYVGAAKAMAPHDFSVLVNEAALLRRRLDFSAAASILLGLFEEYGRALVYTTQFYDEALSLLTQVLRAQPADKRLDENRISRLIEIILHRPFSSGQMPLFERPLVLPALADVKNDYLMHLHAVADKLTADFIDGEDAYCLTIGYCLLSLGLIRDENQKSAVHNRLLAGMQKVDTYSHLISNMIINNEEHRFLNWMEELSRPTDFDDDGFTRFSFALALFKYDTEVAYEFINRVVNMSAGRSVRPGSPLGTLRSMQQNRRQALANSRQEAPSFVNSRDRKLKIAVCVSGQLRGYEKAKSTWDTLGWEGHEIDYYVHCWEKIGRKYPIRHHAGRSFSGKFLRAYRRLPTEITDSPETLGDIYPAFTEMLMGAGRADRISLRGFYNTDKVELEDDAAAPFSSFSNLRKMYYKIYKAFELVENSKIKYDLVIRIRPDFSCSPEDSIDWHRIWRDSTSNSSVYVDRHNLVTDRQKDYRQVCSAFSGDQFACGCFNAMKLYSYTYVTLLDNSTSNRYYYLANNINAAHQSLGGALFVSGVQLEKINLDMELVDQSLISTKTIYEALLQDTKSRPSPNPYDALLLAACEQDLKVATTN